MDETLFEFAPYAMALVDQAGRIIRVNAQLEALFGYARQELQAASIKLLLPTWLQSWHAGSVDMPVSEALPSFQAELQGRRKDASEFPVEIRLSVLPTAAMPATDGHVKPQHIVAIFDLVTYKQRAAQSAELHHRLHDRRIAEWMALAKKLHNEPLQDLQILNFTLAAVTDTLKTAFEDASSTLSIPAILAEVVQIRENIAHTSKQLRQLHQELHPPALTAFGLVTALQSSVQALQSAHPTLRLVVDLPAAELSLPMPLRMALYHVCQQALKNIEQHAQAGYVELHLQAQDEQIILEIIDDGCGFDLPSDWITIVRHGHLGLSSAQERTEAVGGRFAVLSAPGKGTTIRVIAPTKPTDLL